MGRKAKPWYRQSHGAWYGTVAGKRTHLVTGPKEGTATQAHEVFRRLVEEAVDPGIQRVTEMLRRRPELIPVVLRVAEGGGESNPLDDAADASTSSLREAIRLLAGAPEAVDVVKTVLGMNLAFVRVVLVGAAEAQARVEPLVAAARLVDWVTLFRDIARDRLRPGAGRGINPQVARTELLALFDGTWQRWDQDVWVRQAVGTDSQPPWSRLSDARETLPECFGVWSRMLASDERYVDEAVLVRSLGILAAAYPLTGVPSETGH